MTYRFLHTCVESTYEDMLLLEQSEARISIREFVARVGAEAFLELGERLGYDAGFPLEADVHVTFHEGHYRGKRATWMSHSRIEHIFVEEEADG